MRAQPRPGGRLPRPRAEVERLYPGDLTGVGARPRARRRRAPPYLQDAHYPGARKLGRGEGYRYPHEEPGAVTDQPLTPESIRGERFYEPTERGFEAELRKRLEGLRALLGGRGHEDR